MKAGYCSIVVLGMALFAFPLLAQEQPVNNDTGVENGAREIYRGTKAAAKDAAITARVKADLLSDKETKHCSIRVDTHGKGIVELSGDVPSRAIASHAAHIAESVSGVTMVRNELRVRGNSTD
jgi:osmotically-inducible protein OsmY